MNVVDMLHTLGDRPIDEYLWSRLLISHLNNNDDAVSFTADMLGSQALSKVELLSTAKQLDLYQTEVPELVTPVPPVDIITPEPPPGIEDTPPPDPVTVAAPPLPTPTRIERTFLTTLLIGGIFIMVAILAILLGVSALTGGPGVDKDMLSVILGFLMDLLKFTSEG